VAKLASRGVAMLLDVLVQGALLLIAVLVLAFTMPSADSSLTVALLLTLFVLIVIGYPVLFETLSRGRSLGKLALGLRVVRLDGGPIRFRHALTRALAGFFVDFWALGFLGAVAVIVSLTSSDGRRVGDFLAGTLVIRERVPESAQAYVVMPPGLEAWASQLDLSRLPDDLALASRQFLGRYHELRPEAAASLGQGLAHQVANAVRVAIPYGMPPWTFLQAVLAERRNRDQARLAPAYGRPAQYPPQYPPQPGYAPQPTAQPVYPPQPGVASGHVPQPPRAEPENPFTPPS
jgi:uncharacterized RDD family membrane protein YckC